MRYEAGPSAHFPGPCLVHYALKSNEATRRSSGFPSRARSRIHSQTVANAPIVQVRTSMIHPVCSSVGWTGERSRTRDR